MPFGTANNRLRKSLLYDYAKRCNEDFCFRCQVRIDSIEEFSIEHKVSWYYADNPEFAFFDLNNIAFSHISCNIRASVVGNKNSVGHVAPNAKPLVEGQKWCSVGNHYANLHEFTKNRFNSDGLQKECRSHRIR
jgi:hypothetical protein